jgi:signal peptidase I
MSKRHPEGEELKQRPVKSKFRETVEALAIALVLALFIRTFVVQAFKIPSGSMEDTLLIGDHLLVNKFIYGIQNPFSGERYLTIRPPERGDVVVFEFPEDTRNPDLHFWQRKDFIKRVIGTPGDTVAISDKQVFVNGKALNLPQAVHKDPGEVVGDRRLCLETDTFPRPQWCRDFMPPITVPPGHYFVMGDNRDRSFDSRFWGFVPEENIKGLAFIKYWSWNSQTSSPRWGRIGSPIH